MVNEFIHNFCESRLANNTPPEIYNSITSLAITSFPFIFGFPRDSIFYNVATMLVFNGFAGCYYHYNLNWIGKQADDMSMILANYYGIWGFLNMLFNNQPRLINRYNGLNTVFMILFLIVNAVPNTDYYFPYIFTVYTFIYLSLVYGVASKFNYTYKNQFVILCVGANCWIISEVYCTEYTKYGHVVCHLLFPFGFYKLILEYDNHLKDLKILN
jgi:hypothetical protein